MNVLAASSAARAVSPDQAVSHLLHQLKLNQPSVFSSESLRNERLKELFYYRVLFPQWFASHAPNVKSLCEALNMASASPTCKTLENRLPDDFFLQQRSGIPVNIVGKEHAEQMETGVRFFDYKGHAYMMENSCRVKVETSWTPLPLSAENGEASLHFYITGKSSRCIGLIRPLTGGTGYSCRQDHFEEERGLASKTGASLSDRISIEITKESGLIECIRESPHNPTPIFKEPYRQAHEEQALTPPVPPIRS